MDEMTLFQQFAPLFERRPFVPAADVIVTDDDVTVVMDVPGFTPDDLDIELIDDVLTVRGERALPYASGDGHRAWQRLERGFGRFERVIRVPQGLDPDTVAASMADGVLTLLIPKPEARKPRRIEIGLGGGTQPQQIEETTEERELAGATT